MDARTHARFHVFVCISSAHTQTRAVTVGPIDTARAYTRLLCRNTTRENEQIKYFLKCTQPNLFIDCHVTSFFFNLAFLLVHCIESDNSKREQWELAKKEVDFNGNIDCPLGVEWNNLTIQR